jgi:hypothetical protein
MTPVKFEFLGPDGTPLANLTFEIKMAKSGFLELVDGIVMPDTVMATTDALGVVTVLLAPSSSLYYLKVLSVAPDTEEGCCPAGIFYKFYVPDIATEVRVQDLIMDPPPSTKAWDEAAMLLILDAKLHSKASADAAKVSELASKASEDNAKLSEDAAKASELVTIDKAQQASASQLAAKASEDAAQSSEDAAKVSELAAAASADFAAGAVVDMQVQVDEATLQAGNAATSAGQSATSAGASATSAGQAAADRVITQADVVTTTTNKNLTAADVVTSTNLKTEVTGLKDETKGYRDDALAAVGTLGAIIQNGGPIDLSGGAYPAKPAHSTMWKVTVGGVVGGAQGDTYGIGDTLFYAKEQDLFFKIDNTENVSSVAGKTGVVTLVKGDVGLGSVDNTSDVAKPVSTAQQTALDLKIDKTSIVDNLTSTDATKVLSAKQGKSLYDLIQANNVTLVVYEYLATAGQTVFSGVDANGLTLLYTPGTGTIVLRNGVQIERTVDYTATTGSSVTVGQATDLNDLIQVMAFGTFSVANHYTKPEEDALLLTKASKSDTDTKFADRYTKAEDDALLLAKVDKTAVIDVAHGGTGKTTEFRKGFIDGLQLVYTGRNSLTVAAGAAYISSLGKIIELAADKVLTGLTFTASTFCHVYLYENAGVADIELSQTIPVKYYGSAYSKTGDTSRRYLGSLLVNSGAQLYKFQHDPFMLHMRYIEGTPGVAPFQMLASYNNATPADLTSVPAIAPISTAIALHCVPGGTGLVMNFSQNDQFTAPGGANWGLGALGSSEVIVPLSRTPATLGKTVVWTNGSMSLYCYGYYFER